MKKWIISCLLFFLSLAAVIASAQNSDDEASGKAELTGGIYPTEAQGESTNVIDFDRSKIQAATRVKGPAFSKELKITSQSQHEIRPNYYVLEGYVDLIYEGVRLQADHAEYDAVTRDLVATGNVVLDQENQHVTGDKLEINLNTQKGTMYNARGFFPPQIFFWGSRLDKLGEEEYKLYDGTLTECSQVSPHWKLDVTSARMTIDQYVHFKNFTLKAKSIPIFYSPYMLWPIKRDRATGFLFPSFGKSTNKGFYAGGSFFWAMTDYMDTTYWLDYYSLRGFGGGTEYRYAVTEESEGSIRGYFANDDVLGQQWTLNGIVTQKLSETWQMKGIVDYFSSFAYIKDSSQNLTRALSQTRAAQFFITRNWSNYSLNFLGNYSERELSQQNSAYYFHTPEIEFQSRNQQIGRTPFFFSLLSSFDQLGRGRKGTAETKFDLQRYDMFPRISWPMTYLSWLTFTPSYGYRVTRYSKQRDDVIEVSEEPFTRRYQEVVLDLRGPNFNKIFDTPNNGYSKKWKHAIEPQVTFNYTEDIPDRSQILQVDSDIDFVAGSKFITYSITNLFYAKRPIKEQKKYESDEYQYFRPKSLEDETESPWEFISWRLSQSYQLESDSFNPDAPHAEPFTPVRSVLRMNPSVNYNIQFTADYDIKHTQLVRIQVGSTLRSKDKWYANVSYVYSNPVQFLDPGEIGRPAGNSLQTNAGVGLWRNRLVFDGEIGYDATQKEILGSALGVTWNDDCFSIGVQYRYFSDVFRVGGKDRQITFSISLPNIGNLISFNSGAAPARL